MKKIMMLALALMVTTIAFTQRKHHQPNPELQKEMQSYIEKNVAPVLQKAQDEFDAKLNAEDLKFIQAKRTEAATIRAEKRAEHQKKMEERKANRPKTEEERKARKEEFKKMTEAEKEAFRAERKEKRKAKRAERKGENGESRAEVKSFMKRNEALVKSTMEGLKPNYEKWVTDQKAIMEKYRPADAPKMKEGKRKSKVGLFGLAPHRGKHHKKGMKGKRGKKKAEGDRAEKSEKRKGRKGGKLATTFVLWDGTTPQPPAQTRNDLGQNISPNENVNTLLGQNFPNPAKDITRVEIEIPEGVNQLNLTVTDMNGKVVKQLNLTDLNQGRETVAIDVNDLPNGQYFYTIENGKIKASKKMTVNH